MSDPQVALALDKARRSLQAAERLLAAGDYDFAVSRAYYAMFYAAEALLLSEGKSFSKHSAVIACFGRDFAREGKVPAHLHRYLLDAFSLRNLADYRLGQPVDSEDARSTLAQADEFVSEVSRVLGSEACGENSR